MYIIYKFKDKKYCRIILLMEPFNMYAFIIYFQSLRDSKYDNFDLANSLEYGVRGMIFKFLKDTI